MPRRRSGGPTGSALEADLRRWSASRGRRPCAGACSCRSPTGRGRRRTRSARSRGRRAARPPAAVAELLGHAVEDEIGSAMLALRDTGTVRRWRRRSSWSVTRPMMPMTTTPAITSRRLHVAARRPDDEADARLGRDDLGDDQIGPAPAERDAEIVDQVRQHGAEGHVGQHLARLGAERVGDLDIFVRHAPHVVGDEQHELEEGAEPEQEDLGLLADAEPDDRQRHQRRNRQIADEIDDRLERRADDAVAAHQDADRERPSPPRCRNATQTRSVEMPACISRSPAGRPCARARRPSLGAGRKIGLVRPSRARSPRRREREADAATAVDDSARSRRPAAQGEKTTESRHRLLAATARPPPA